jgi:hypothetical protein
MSRPFDWVNKRNNAHLKWIDGYLKRKSLKGSTLFTEVKNPAIHGYFEMAKSLNELPDEAEYREASRQMKWAWNTHQYRKNNGNPVSLQMSADTLEKCPPYARS